MDIDYDLLHYRLVFHPDDADEKEEEMCSWEEGEAIQGGGSLTEEEIAYLEKEQQERIQAVQAEVLKNWKMRAAARLKRE